MIPIVMQDPVHIGRHAAIPLGEVVFRTMRSSGPGGQHANVTESRVEASFDVAASTSLTDDQKRRIIARAGPRVTAVAQDARGQARNRELALDRLRRRLTAALVVPKSRRPTRPTKAATRRRLDAKRRNAERKSRRRPPSHGDD
jgi:ribosome-associated protein